MPPGTNDLLVLIAGITGFLGVAAIGITIVEWIRTLPARRERRAWERHVRSAMRLANDAGWPREFGFSEPRPVSKRSIREAHAAELAEGSRARHPAFRDRRPR